MADSPTLIVQISDPHLRLDMPERDAALQAAVAQIAALRPQPVAVLLTGDIADHGDPAEYQRARKLLEPLRAPVHVIPGNKDDRGALRAAFGLPGEGDAEIRYTADAGPLRLVMCDSTIPGEFGGRLDVSWLADRLAQAPGTPTIVAMHHPPYAIGVEAIDAIGIDEESHKLLEFAILSATQVLRVVAGHVHRASSGAVGSRPAVTAPSLSFQLGLNFESGELAVSDDGPGFLIHAFTDGRIATHYVPVVP